MKYRPRRSSARWMEQAPEYVLAVYDNGGKTCDRYTVLFGGSLWEPALGRNVQYLGLSSNPSHPQGFSQWGEMPAANRGACGKHINWLDLPENVRGHVISRAVDGEGSCENY